MSFKQPFESSYLSILQKSKNRSKRLISMSVDWEKKIRRSTDHGIVKRGSGDISQKEETTFCTGSVYKGQWDYLGMAGTGRYKLFNGKYYF